MAQDGNFHRDAARLLADAGDGDAALLYLAMYAGSTVRLSAARRESAMLTLRRLGLVETPPLAREHRPEYTEQDVTSGLQAKNFQSLTGEVQRMLGRLLSTEELKSLLSIHEYLQLPSDVVSVLVSYCIRRSQTRSGRMPTLRAIEKEAYRWSDLEIDTVEAAVSYMQAQLQKQSRVGRICTILQISGRRLTSAETRYVEQWIDWGFPDETIALAYEKTCLQTAGLKWPYLNAILSRWHESGLHTVAEVKKGDTAAPKRGASRTAVSDLERDAVRRLMEED